MLDFIERHGLTFPSVNDQAGDVFAAYGVPGQPAWVFVDASGRGTRMFGALTDDQLDEAIAAIA